MGLSVVKVAAGGLPVTLATSGGLPCTEATNGFGIAVTQSPTGGGVAVTGITFGPTIALSASSVLETAAVNTTVGTLSVTPGTTGSPVFTLADSAGGKFNILGTALRTNAALDYETAASHNIIVAVSGVTPAVANRTIAISVTDVAEPVIALTGTTVNEDAAVNTTVGTLSVANTYTGTPVYTLTDSAGGKFNISGNLLRVNAALDYETATTHNITARVTGITPPAADKVFTVLVLDITESGGSYQGPGDIKAGALGWWGLRAYSAAQCTGSVAAIQVVKASDGTSPTDINIKTDGLLDVAAITALGYPVKCLKLYDQSGNGRHMVAPNHVVAPTVTVAGLGGTKPCLTTTEGNNNLTNAGFGAVAQPYTISQIFNRTINNSAYEAYFAPGSTYGLLGNNAANGTLMYVGGGVAATSVVADGVIHAGQFVFNDASSATYIDGVTTSSLALGSTAGWPSGAIFIGANGAQNAPIMQWAEVGFWGSAFSAGDAALVTTNQTNYLAGIGGGGGGGLTKNIVTDYGAVADGEWATTTLNIAAGTSTLTASSALWVAGDVGKSIVIPTLAFGSSHHTTISAVGGGGTQVTLASPCPYALSAYDAIVAWGTNNETAFQTFKTAYQGQTITLTIPAGGYLISAGNFGGLFDGIRNITVNATGATLCGDLWQILASAQYEAAGHAARTTSVTAGATFVTLATPSQVSRFVIGDYAMMSGFDMQNLGYPTNHALFEYLLITAIDSDSGSPTYGRITFQTPLVNSYLSTWPVYNATGTDFGGPATLYAMDPRFNHTCVVNGMTIAQFNQYGVSGLSLTLNNCVFEGIGQIGPHPTQAKTVVFNNCTSLGSTLEVDKLVETFTLTGCTWSGLAVQSSSINEMILDNTDITFTLNGTPRRTVIRNGCTIGTLTPGPTTYGYARELDVRDSVITNFGAPTYHTSGHEIRSGDGSGDGIQADFSIEDGVITIPASMRFNLGASQWAITGGKVYLYDPNIGTLGLFTITDVTEASPGSGNIFVATDMSLDDWPARSYSPSLGLWLYTHTAPDCTFVNSSGCPEVVMLSSLPAHIPLYSRYSGSFNAATAVTTPYWPLAGRIKSVVVTVTTPYVGATTPARAVLMFGNATVRMSDYADVIWNQTIDLKTAGTRTFDTVADPYPTAWVGSVGADALTGMPSAQWATSNFYVFMDARVAGTGPVFTVEVITDQEAVTVPPSPATILTGLIGWWDASVTASMTLAVASIVNMADQSGAGNHLGNGVATNKPQYSATGLNSRPAMVFTAINARALGSTSAFPLGTGNTLTFFLVARLESAAHTFGRAISYGAPGASHDYDNAGSFALTRNNGTAALLFVRNAGSTTPAMSYSTPHRIIGTVNSSGLMTLYIDGVSVGTATQAGNWVTGGGLGIGGGVYDFTQHWDGAIGEVGIATGYSDATAVASLDTYLKNKWGL